MNCNTSGQWLGRIFPRFRPRNNPVRFRGIFYSHGDARFFRLRFHELFINNREQSSNKNTVTLVFLHRNIDYPRPRRCSLLPTNHTNAGDFHIEQFVKNL